MFRCSLRTLFVVVTLAALASFVGYLLTQPFWVVERFPCGNGRRVELLAPNEFCDVAGSMYYRFTGMKSPEPLYFATWACEADPPLTLITAEQGDLVAITSYSADELDIMVDFKTGCSWPQSPNYEVDDNARNMLKRLRRENGDLWLNAADDEELTKGGERGK